MSQDVENADCIVVLSGDYGNRIAKGVELYKSGKANYLILTGPHLQEKYFFKEDLPCNPSWADLMKSYTLRHGVERSHIYSFTTEAESTRHEAKLATEFIKTMNWSFIVVTSDYHTRHGIRGICR